MGLIAEELSPLMETQSRAQRAVANGLWPALSRTGTVAACNGSTELELGAAGGVVGARGIIEKTMAIVLGLVISTPKLGSLQATQRPSSFLTSWGCGEVSTGSLA